VAVTDPFLIAADLFDPQPDPYAAKPVEFAGEVLGFHAWSLQRRIMEAVRDHSRVAVRSSHGPGKTATAAQVALWFLAAHRNSRVITTAPTWAQVEQLLWREIRASVARAHGRGKGEMFPKPTATKLELGDQWFAIGLSTNEPERFQGHHATHLLLVVDEASGVDERIFEAAEGFLTAEGAHILLVGNPTRVGGQFHRAFTTERASWHTIHISTEDTPNYTGEPVPPEVARQLPRKGWAEEKKRAWGEKSPMYQVRVLGNFPPESADGVVSLHEVEMAQRRELPVAQLVPAQPEDAVVVCDVARFGDDETVIGTKFGPRIRICRAYNGKDLMQTVGAIVEVWRELGDETRCHPRIIVDDDGLGGGVTDRLREQGYEVTPFRGGARAIESKKYPNARSEAWFRMARQLPELDLDGDEQLAADLTSPTFKLNSDGQRVVEPKAETKKRLGRSPDRGDMALLALVPWLDTTPPPPESRMPAASPDALGDFEASRPRSGSLTGDLLNDPM
jgi:phage terminase large subunit